MQPNGQLEIQVRDIAGKIAIEIVHRLHSSSEVEIASVTHSLESGRDDDI